MKKTLMEIMDTLVRLNKDIYAAFKDERECLIHNNIDRLRIVVSQEMEIGAQIARTEEQRNSLITRFKNHYAIETEAVRLADLAHFVEEPYASHYVARGEELRAIINDIIKLRNFNNALIKKMLLFNEKQVNLFMGLGKKDLTYDGAGAISHSRKQILDSVI